MQQIFPYLKCFNINVLWMIMQAQWSCIYLPLLYLGCQLYQFCSQQGIALCVYGPFQLPSAGECSVKKKRKHNAIVSNYKNSFLEGQCNISTIQYKYFPIFEMLDFKWYSSSSRRLDHQKLEECDLFCLQQKQTNFQGFYVAVLLRIVK